MNKFDYLILLIILVGALGLLYSPLYPSRVLAIIISPYVIRLIRKKEIHIPKYIKNFFLVWIFTAIISLLWSYSRIDGVKALFYNYCNIILFFSIYVFAHKARKPFTSIYLGWIIWFLITSLFALYEFSTGNHLDNAVQDETAKITSLDGITVQRMFASVTYGNLNNYNVIVCYCVMFIMSAIAYFYNKIQLALWGLLLLAVYIVMMNASRGAFLCLILSICIFLPYILKKNGNRLLMILLLIASVSFIILNSEMFLGQIFGRLSTSNIADDNTRINIWKNALKALEETLGLGVGMGGDTIALLKINPREISATHNMFLEFLLQFGIVPFIFFLKMIYCIIKKCIVSKDLYLKLLGLLMCVTLIPINIINSKYLLMTFFWMFWGSAFTLSQNKIIQNVVR